MLNIKLKNGLLFILALGLIALSWQAVKMGAANLNFYEANQQVDKWLTNNDDIKPAKYQKTLSAINRANIKHPDNAQYLITQGLIYELGATRNVFTTGVLKSELTQSETTELALTKAELIQAKAYYLKAVELRPTWPITWATLASVKVQLGEIDQDVVDYLMQAEKYGAYSLGVHELWLEIGFYLYYQHSVYTVQIIEGLRRHLEVMLKNPNQKYKKSAKRIIKRHNAEKLACRWSKNYHDAIAWHTKYLCKPLKPLK